MFKTSIQVFCIVAIQVKVFVFCTVLLLTGWSGASIHPALAASSLAIHSTLEELAILRQRRNSGPYKSDWNRIKGRADDFMRNPNSETWPGNQTNQRWNDTKVKSKQQGKNLHPSRDKGQKLRDAAFVYLLEGNTRYRDQVRDTLLAEARKPGADFCDKSKWNYQNKPNGQEDFSIPNYVRKLAYGYSYLRSTLSPSDRKTLNAWFLCAGQYFDALVHNNVKARFPHRLSDDYSLTSNSKYSPGHDSGATHYGGHHVHTFHKAWVNIPATYTAAVATIGIMMENMTLKNNAKRFFKEWVKYCVDADGFVCDQFRWNTKSRYSKDEHTTW